MQVNKLFHHRNLLKQDVKFPMKLDTYDLCTPDLQKRLKPVRERFASQDEAESEAAIALKQQHKGDKVAMKKAAAKTGKKGAAHKESDYEPYHFSSGKRDLADIIFLEVMITLKV